MAHMASSVDVFFSCVPADRERVQHVREMIEKAGYSCWYRAAPPLRPPAHKTRIF